MWIITLAVAYGLGYNSPFSKGFSDKPNPVANERFQNQTSETKTEIKSATITSQDDSNFDIDKISTELKSLLSSQEIGLDIEALFRSHELLKSLSEQQLVEVLRTLAPSLSQSKKLGPLLLIFGRYAELNPKGAISYIRDDFALSRLKVAILSSVISKWSKTDPTAAYDWTKEQILNNHTAGRITSDSYGLTTIFGYLAKQDLYDALEKLMEIANYGANTEMAIIGISNTLKHQDEFIALLENPAVVENKRGKEKALTLWVNINPQDATEWLDSNQYVTDKNKLQIEALTVWLKDDPLSAADWYMSKAKGSNRQKQADTIIYRWRSGEPQQKLDWLSNQTEIDLSRSTYAVLQSTVYTHPDFVIRNINLLSTDSEKLGLSIQIHSALSHRNKQAAANFLESSPLKDQINEQIRKRNQHKSAE